MTTTYRPGEIAERGRAIYAAEIRPSLTETDKGKFLYIHTERHEWVIDADDLKAGQDATRLWGKGQPVYIMQVGYRALASFRPGIDLELKEW